ncbi:Cdc48 subfamily AAA family protein [Natranaerovirga pectinivora]|uniref:Cdc48 subfamily AAA family protein n=1 Tax=Natranaerovirga pectinivora TaxID=682400 RepID=A0A4R3MM56_9FIRM|nr:AAA family ATPase [Natranaerovirga pectinivora]TCT16013.1 Cdc48 subfamily AAA family protein [Natranaerovirga pectinivora]
MAIDNAFNRLKREIGIKRCIIIDGNVGDVYLNEKCQVMDLKTYIKQVLNNMNYDNVICWDKVDGTKDDIGNLKLVEDVDVEGEAYLDNEELSDILGDSSANTNENKSGSIDTTDIKEMLSIVMKNLINKNKKVAFILNWADFMFSGSQLPPDEREQLTILGKAIREKMPDYNSTDVNESTVILITNKLAMFPVAFYQGNPEVSTITLPKPDREEREAMMRKISYSFNVITEKGKDLMECEKINEYIDMLNDFTNRELMQLARLSRKEGKMAFDKLFLLFKYGEKDNPWEKLVYSEVKNIKNKLGERVIGQEKAIEKIEKVVIKAYMGMTGIHKTSSRSMPKGVLFFVGPTGVGKTELSKALAKFLFGDEDACIRFDMSEYAQENSDQKLIGAPPGYVGYEEGGQLTNAIKEKPFSVILFDEIEKAAKPNPRILDIFLQILEDGRLTDSKGETVYFSESVIIFTSNLGASEVDPGAVDVASEFIEIVKKYFNKEIKRPELLGRIGYSNIVPFNFIQDDDFRLKIAQSKLKPIKKGIEEKYHMKLAFDDELAFINYVIGDADKSKGGRDILNALNDRLLDALAMFLFKHKEDLVSLRGSKIYVETKQEGLTFRFE